MGYRYGDAAGNKTQRLQAYINNFFHAKIEECENSIKKLRFSFEEIKRLKVKGEKILKKVKFPPDVARLFVPSAC